MKSNTLLCNRLTGRYTAEIVFERYCETLADFKITEKIMHVITDNASNMINFVCLDMMVQPLPLILSMMNP